MLGALGSDLPLRPAGNRRCLTMQNNEVSEVLNMQMKYGKMSDYMDRKRLGVFSPDLGQGLVGGGGGRCRRWSEISGLVLRILGEARRLKIIKCTFQAVDSLYEIDPSKPSVNDCTFSDKQISISKNASCNFFPQSNKTVSDQ